MKVTFYIIALVFTVVNSALAQNAGAIMGVVVDDETKVALPGASIVLADTGQATNADSNGVFSFFNVPQGTYNIKAIMMGYAKTTFNNIRIGVDSTVILNINLIPTCICYSLSNISINIDSQAVLATEANTTLALYKLKTDYHKYNCKDRPWKKVYIHRKH